MSEDLYIQRIESSILMLSLFGSWYLPEAGGKMKFS